MNKEGNNNDFGDGCDFLNQESLDEILTPWKGEYESLEKDLTEIDTAYNSAISFVKNNPEDIKSIQEVYDTLRFYEEYFIAKRDSYKEEFQKLKSSSEEYRHWVNLYKIFCDGLKKASEGRRLIEHYAFNNKLPLDKIKTLEEINKELEKLNMQRIHKMVMPCLPKQ